VNRKKHDRKVMSEKKNSRSASTEPEASELWIDPKLNRTVAGPGGNRGEHTTSSAKLLELADIALKKGA
jgi:hypothetical protein